MRTVGLKNATRTEWASPSVMRTREKRCGEEGMGREGWRLDIARRGKRRDRAQGEKEKREEKGMGEYHISLCVAWFLGIRRGRMATVRSTRR
jgi:hypothetical protein